MALDGRCAHRSAKISNIGLGKLPDPRFDGVSHGIQRRLRDKLHPSPEIAIGGDDRAEQILDKRRGIVLALVPA